MNFKDLLIRFETAIAALPPHPVAPENRNLARLHPSPWVPRGTIYRLFPESLLYRQVVPLDQHGLRRPLILMNELDVAEVLQAMGPYAAMQQVADLAEQVFAEQEAKG